MDSPVYVYHASGQMMSFLDHFGTWWVVHRPRPEMSGKQAVTICTAAGGGMKTTARDMADSLEMWGVRKVYRLARQIRQYAGKRGCNGQARKWFALMRFAHKHFPPSEPDYGYWEERGWHGKRRPWDGA